MSSRIRTVTSIGIMGFGAFGRLMARHLQPHFALRVCDPANAPIADAAGKGLQPAISAEVATCDIVILAVPVPAIPEAIAALRPHLRAGAIVLDVGSVKIGPARAMQAELPEDIEIIGTHPLFGPQSARNGLAGLKIALCPVRGGSTPRIAAFLLAAVFATGAITAGFHAGGELKWWDLPAACAAGGDISLEGLTSLALGVGSAPKVAMCDSVAWSWLGVSMAGWNFLISLALAVFSLLAAKRPKDARAPRHVD